jgi:hypothetical protein
LTDDLLGQVVKWNEQKKFGFIEYDRTGEACRMFFIRDSCQPDAIGRISDCFVISTLVKFSIERQIRNGEGRLIACNVRPAFREEFTGDVDTYRESGWVVRWLIKHKNGFLQRPSGEQVYFQLGDVAPGHEYQFQNLVEGDWLYYGITSQTRNGVLMYRATNIECYNDQEQSRLRQGLPLVEEPAPVSTPAPEPTSVLAPETRSLSLLEIRRRRNG